AIRYSSANSEGKLHLETENGNKSESILLPATGSDDNWKTIILPQVSINFATNKIKVLFERGGFNLNYLDFKESKK
ncbi:MAG: endoglucanase, partial [Bacteroidota bacterium]|nr:endoglucanase [Bacteroidota bacterium]